MMKKNKNVLLMSDDSSDEPDDEVTEIKRAMREARARKKSLASKLKIQWEKDNSEKNELEEIIRKATDEIENLKKKLSQTEFDLKEVRYENNQWSTKFQALQEEKKNDDRMFQSKLSEMQMQLDNTNKLHEDRLTVIALESDKVCKIMDSFLETSQIKQNDSLSKTMRHLLRKAIACMEKVKMTTSNPNINIADLRAHSAVINKEILSADSAVDSAMLEMCKNLEEENISLSKTIEDLKQQLSESKREASASQLIPHYRLAILRSRTYAANLLEQVQREQATSQALREQLDETYADLKKVVDEKRRLYKKLSKAGLQSEETAYMNVINGNKAGDGRPFSPTQKQNRRENTSHRSESVYEQQYHNVDGKVQRVVNALSPDADLRINPVDMEKGLKDELRTLDDQIELLKSKLGQAAVLKSQKILADVIDSSLATLPS